MSQRFGSFRSRCRSEFWMSTMSVEVIVRSCSFGVTHEKLLASLMSPDPL